jgi:hypothetical protein
MHQRDMDATSIFGQSKVVYTTDLQNIFVIFNQAVFVLIQKLAENPMYDDLKDSIDTIGFNWAGIVV